MPNPKPQLKQSHYLKPENKWFKAINQARTRGASTLAPDLRTPGPKPEPNYDLDLPYPFPGAIIAHPPVREDYVIPNPMGGVSIQPDQMSAPPMSNQERIDEARGLRVKKF